MIPRDLGDSLILRQATAEDTAALADCNGRATGNWETGEPDEGTANWTRDLMQGRHPNVSPSDITVVEDTRSGAIVSSICLISHPCLQLLFGYRSLEDAGIRLRRLWYEER